MEKRVVLPYVTFTEFEAIGHPPQIAISKAEHHSRPKPGMPIHYCPFCGKKLEDPSYIHKHTTGEVGTGRNHG